MTDGPFKPCQNIIDVNLPKLIDQINDTAEKIMREQIAKWEARFKNHKFEINSMHGEMWVCVKTKSPHSRICYNDLSLDGFRQFCSDPESKHKVYRELSLEVEALIDSWASVEGWLTIYDMGSIQSEESK